MEQLRTFPSARVTQGTVPARLCHRVPLPWAGEGSEGSGRGWGVPCPCPCPPQVAMESPHREAEPGQQEQELRQILNKDKSKRSKGSLRPGGGPEGLWGGGGSGGSALTQTKLCVPVGERGGRASAELGCRPRWDPRDGLQTPFR